MGWCALYNLDRSECADRLSYQGTRTQEVIDVGKNKKPPAKSLKEKRAEKQAKAAASAPTKTLSKTARASGAGKS